jgi:hypothetical protein
MMLVPVGLRFVVRSKVTSHSTGCACGTQRIRAVATDAFKVTNTVTASAPVPLRYPLRTSGSKPNLHSCSCSAALAALCPAAGSPAVIEALADNRPLTVHLTFHNDRHHNTQFRSMLLKQPPSLCSERLVKYDICQTYYESIKCIIPKTAAQHQFHISELHSCTAYVSCQTRTPAACQPAAQLLG